MNDSNDAFDTTTDETDSFQTTEDDTSVLLYLKEERGTEYLGFQDRENSDAWIEFDREVSERTILIADTEEVRDV